MSHALPNLKGRVAFVFEERDFDVDQIIGVKNIKIQDVDELAALAMQSYDPDFQKSVGRGDVIVGGRATIENGNITLPDGPGFIWTAGETSVARAVRSYLIDVLGHSPEWIKAAGYWVHGQSDTSEKNL